MLFENLEFFNVIELDSSPYFSGLKLQRYPDFVRKAFEGEKGRFRSMESSGCEIRFVTNAPNFRIYLSLLESNGEVLVMNGDIHHSVHRLQAGVLTTLHLSKAPMFKEVSADTLQSSRFSSDVWRIFFGRYCALYHGIESFGYDLRPPNPHELPKLRWLTYGSSITHGAGAQSHSNCFVQQAARRLGVDVLSLGQGGSCLCEPEVADFIANRDDWDFVTLEIGVNMRKGYTKEQFKQRALYFIESIKQHHIDKPLVLITTFPNSKTYEVNKTNEGLTESSFNEILRELATDSISPALYLIEGNEILTDFTALDKDLIHPSDYGHTLMGENLANRLRPIISAE